MESVKVVLRNYQTKETIDYTIIPRDNQLAKDWITALKQDVLQKSLHLEKNFCFHGFPYTQRTLGYLCDELNRHIKTINLSEIDYVIEITDEDNGTFTSIKYGDNFVMDYMLEKDILEYFYKNK